jgi:dephospho-CoA kinase
LKTKVFVGITGGIGSGKTFVCQVLETMGYPVFYSDKEAKKIIVSNKIVKKSIIDLFGKEAYTDSGKINTSFLSKQIFNDKTLLNKMNGIVHPAVRLAFKEWATGQKSKIVFNEAAIIFETGIYKNYKHVVLVTAPKDLKIKRITKRDQSTIEQIENRMKNQWTDQKKAEFTNLTINNDEQSMLIPQIVDVLNKLTHD